MCSLHVPFAMRAREEYRRLLDLKRAKTIAADNRVGSVISLSLNPATEEGGAGGAPLEEQISKAYLWLLR